MITLVATATDDGDRNQAICEMLTVAFWPMCVVGVLG
jgi:hypothetical protein